MKTVNKFFYNALFHTLLFLSLCYGQGNWTKDSANPVMSGGYAGSWDHHVFNPRVLYNSDSSRYEMWFGATANFSTNYGRPYKIGFAYSEDGINWTKHPTPVLEAEPGAWDEWTVEGHTVLRENGMYKMWYFGSDNEYNDGIGYATSPDGIHWTKNPNNNK